MWYTDIGCVTQLESLQCKENINSVESNFIQLIGFKLNIHEIVYNMCEFMLAR